MQVQSEGKLEWAGVVASGSPLALALLDLGEGLTDGAVMVACQEDDDAARAVALAELEALRVRVLEVVTDLRERMQLLRDAA